MITKHLLVPKNFWLVLAWTWTVIVTILCLVRFTDLPSIGVKSADKYVHAIFHFIFVLVWSQYYRSNRQDSERHLVVKALLYSVVFGCLIEAAQEYLTTTRQADLKDVAANFTGAVLGVLVQLATGLLRKRKTE